MKNYKLNKKRNIDLSLMNNKNNYEKHLNLNIILFEIKQYYN